MSSVRSMPGTIASAMADMAAQLARAGIAEPRREARLLVALALGVDPATVLGYPERAIDGEAEMRLQAFATRRAAREPYARIAGHRQFWSLDFALTRDTLDPRPDSETLIEAALECLPDRSAPLRIIDFGTGSGCLLLSLLRELPRATGLGIDILPGAAAAARRNAAALGLAERALFVAGSWDAPISWTADVILANPPYIPSQEIETLAPEVAGYEPRAALDGGNSGLDAYRPLGAAAYRVLAPAGIAFFEVGAGQAEGAAAVLIKRGLRLRSVKRDLARIERCLVVEGPAC